MWQIICVTGFIITAQNSNQNNQVSSTINNASTNDSNSNSISSSSSSNSDSGYIGESAAKSSARGYFDEYSLGDASITDVSLYNAPNGKVLYHVISYSASSGSVDTYVGATDGKIYLQDGTRL